MKDYFPFTRKVGSARLFFIPAFFDGFREVF